jgi:hypothetical protein
LPGWEKQDSRMQSAVSCFGIFPACWLFEQVARHDLFDGLFDPIDKWGAYQ